MESIEDFKLYFEQNIKPRLDELESWRIKNRNYRTIKLILFSTLVIAFFAVYFYFLLFSDNNRFSENTHILIEIGLAVFSVLGIGIIILTYTTFKSIMNPWQKVGKDKEYKNIVIKETLNYISPELSYSAQRQKVSGEEFLGSEMFPHSVFYPIGYYAEDFVEGKIGKINIRYYEINGKDTSVMYNDKADYDREEKIPFYGMFMVADFNKTFKGYTLAVSKENIIDLLWINTSGRRHIKMDSPEFEKRFSVFGTDPVTAMYVLSTSLMERIVKYNEKVGKPITLSFSNNRLYIAIKHTKNNFEFSLSRSLFDFGLVEKFYQDLKLATEMVEDLNLNTQIWLKDDKNNTSLFQQPVNFKYAEFKPQMQLLNYLY